MYVAQGDGGGNAWRCGMELRSGGCKEPTTGRGDQHVRASVWASEAFCDATWMERVIGSTRAPTSESCRPDPTMKQALAKPRHWSSGVDSEHL